MNKLKNDRLIRALLHQPIDRTPLWIMRQAGRYLPEFRQLRKENPNFIQFCKTPALACEATLQPLARFDLDAAIIFSDILTVLDALGLNLEYLEKIGPVIHNPIRAESDLKNLSVDRALDNLQYVYEAISLTQQKLAGKIPLIGFAGSPWTVACYAVSGQNHDEFATIRKMVYQNPKLLHSLLQCLTDITVQYLNSQIKAGARTVMLFDSWAGALSSLTYHDFSLQYMQQIAKRMLRDYLGEKIPLIFFAKNASAFLEPIAESGCDAVGLDWTVNLREARDRLQKRVALQGNLDPLALFGPHESIGAMVKAIFTQMGPGTGFVFNLGHGIDKDTPIENVAAFVQAVHQFGVQS